MSSCTQPRREALFIGLCALLGLSGCNLAPKYSVPSVALGDSYKEAWKPAQPADAGSRGAWWEVYGDAQLDALEAKVAISNQNLVAAEANYRAARAAVVAARSALFPTLSAAPAITRSRASPNTLPAGDAGTVNEFNVSGDISYTVDLWGRVRNTVAASAFTAQATAADLATAVLSTQAELAQDYFQIRALDTQKEILDDTVVSYRQALDVTQTLYQSGIDSDEDVARAQNQVDDAVAEQTDTGVSRAAFEHAIAVLIGETPEHFSLPAAPLSGQAPDLPAGVPSDLLQRRPDIAAAERRVAAANAEIGVARTAYFPTLTLSASGGWESASSSNLLDWPSRFWSIGPQLAGVLFDPGARQALNAQARASYDATAAQYRQVVLSSFQSVEDNLAALRLLGQEAEQQRIAVESARHVLDLANTRFRTGIDSYLNVITAETSLLTDRESEVQVRLRQMNASVSLILALGGGWTTAALPAKDAVAKL